MPEGSSPRHDGPTPLALRVEFGVLLALHVAMLLGSVWALLQPAPTLAHPGQTAADGCHHDRRNGGRHCHGGSASAPASATRVQRAAGGAVHYPNCTAARAAGAAPVSRGDPGYASHLDRDSDGIGCE